MFNKIKLVFLSAVIGFGTLTALPAGAHADGIYFSFGGNGARAGVHAGHEPRYQRPPRHRSGRYHRHAPRYERSCSTQQAVRKASRMGLRHARVAQANHRILRVSGRKGRNYGSIVFARTRDCPVIRYR
ncbi:hypothetical protein [Chelativorans sp. YIM 93263]|uniref:hypothetical protein n=1 Tax=Chelativorans sp. YIM 93263 TaxID=2906648 RepID=UPI002377E9AF|nr:hypothetical protein [Chelativorans sp. YIM 93263]